MENRVSIEQEAKLIAEVDAGKMTEESLIALHRNAETKGAIAVMEAVKRRLRADFPRV